MHQTFIRCSRLLCSSNSSLRTFPRHTKLTVTGATDSAKRKIPTSQREMFSQSHHQQHQEQQGHQSRFKSFVWSIPVGAAITAFSYFLFSNRKNGTISFHVPSVSAAEKINENNISDDDTAKGKTKRRQTHNFIADVVQEVQSTLVYIEIKDLNARDFFTNIPVTNSNGSGFIVKEDGLILTNAHVVSKKPNSSIQVRLQDGRVFVGTLEDIDIKSDLATVRIPCKDLPTLTLGTSSSVRPGEFVIAMGSPLSLSNTITTGVVSTASRSRKELGLQWDNRDVPDYIQTDAAITFGNSGGPLVNLDGEAIGINSMKITPGISFAIPIDYAKEFLKRSEEGGQARRNEIERRKRGYLGITMITINPQIKQELKSTLRFPPSVQHGIVVVKIVRGSPAHLAGLVPGDIITHINDKAINGSQDVYHLLENPDGQALKIKVVRGEIALDIYVTPEM